MIELKAAHELDVFKKLVRMRARIIWPLSVFLVLALAGNLYLMSAGSNIGGRLVSENGVITIALAYSLGLIFLGASAAVFYVWWANKYLDPLMEKVCAEISKLGEGA